MRKIYRRQALQFIAAAGGLSIAGRSVTAGSNTETRTNSAAATQQTKLVPSDGDSEDQFGASVAIDGDRALVGAMFDQNDGENDDLRRTDAGSTYVFEWSGEGWSQRAKLTGGEPLTAPSANFGGAVALDGDTALIGALDQGFTGAAYVLELSGGNWIAQAELTPPTTVPYPSLFGAHGTVALDGNTALVGAPGESIVNDYPGSAYVFEGSNADWSRTQLIADDGDAGDEFGCSVALDGDTALIGAIGDEDPNGTGAGSAYVFERSAGSWSQQAKLTGTEGNASAAFGNSVALEGDTALVGARGDDSNATGAGSAYVFERSGGNWSQQTKLTADDGDTGDQFGSDVALDGPRAIFGAQFGDPSGSASGCAYIFEQSDGSWSQRAKLSADDGDANDFFGASVELSGDTAIVGSAVDEDPNGTEAGSAYVFDLSGESGGDGPPPIAGGTPPTDPDGDELYEDIDGDGELTIGDVQLFFQNRNSAVVQDNAEFFNFSGNNAAKVTIADVQALFQEFRNADE